MTEGLISAERKRFLASIIKDEVWSYAPASKDTHAKFGVDWVASNADVGNKLSIDVSNALIETVSQSTKTPIVKRSAKMKGQTLGNKFEASISKFITCTFRHFSHLRPGEWSIDQITSRKESVIGEYEQYAHLSSLGDLIEKNKDLRTFLGEGYAIAPDIVVARKPEPDEEINANLFLLDDNSVLKSKLRARNHDAPNDPRWLLHASVSCKFTMRSDRAQNTRTEALNLIRSRKGRSPHIVAVTAEPLPSRIASLALGTGDLDCVYHFALYELFDVLRALKKDDAIDLLRTMVDGMRLKDISDLPLDLAV
tara:strand:- start:2583 stop:3512 length:930 start_codon:yes stop_codon:yes gene_type:complete